MERWVDCYLYPNYEVSDMGRVRNKRTGHLIKLQKNPNGHKIIWIGNGFQKGTRKVSRLIYMSFKADFDPFKLVCHRDKNISNIKLENLFQQTRGDIVRAWSPEKRKRICSLGGKASNKARMERWGVKTHYELMSKMSKIRWDKQKD